MNEFTSSFFSPLICDKDSAISLIDFPRIYNAMDPSRIEMKFFPAKIALLNKEFTP